MKPIHILCASQAATSISTATTVTMDSDIASSSSAASNGGRAIDRHNPIIQDQKRLTRTLPPHPPSTPNNHHTKKKTKNPKNNDPKRKTIAFADENNDQELITNTNGYVKNPGGSATVVRRQGGVLLGWGCTKPGDFISPATSSRYLLTDKALSDQFDPLLKQIPPPPPPPPPEKAYIFDAENYSMKKKDEGHVPSAPCKTPPPPPPPPPPEKPYVFDAENYSFKKKDEEHLSSSPPPKTTSPRLSSSSLSSGSSDHQVVVLRVSLHCKGCEKKMRKHISKMEGVTSFNIDFMAKKVTVVGNVTPLSVLTSVSKVKNAKLLNPTTISSSHVPPTDSNFSEIKKQLGVVT